MEPRRVVVKWPQISITLRRNSLRIRIKVKSWIRMRIRNPGSDTVTDHQCCGSRIKCLFDPWNRDLGRIKNQDPDPRIIFLRVQKQFFGVKEYLNSFLRTR
jgi:hypothetical protein